VRRYRIVADDQRVLAEVADNHQAHNRIRLASPVTTKHIDIAGLRTENRTPPAVFEIRCFSC
jgi:hypothetical protein